MIQFKSGDLTMRFYYPRLRLPPRTNLLIHHRPPLHYRHLENSIGLILRILDPKDIFDQDKLNEYFDPIKDQPFLWFSLKEKTSLLVFQNELFLAVLI